MAEENKESRRLLSADERREAVERSDKEAAKTEYKPRTAHDVVAEVGPVDVADAKEKAREAGVTDAAFIGYEEALGNYESRPDVETLKERRAREAGETFDEAGFRRKIGGSDNAGVVSTDTAVKGADEPKAVEEQAVKPTPRKSGK